MPEHGRRATVEGEGPGFIEELKEGLRFIAELPLIRSLILGVVGVFFGAGVVISLGPAFVGTSLGGADTDWFTLMAFVGVGLVLGIIAVSPIVKRFSKERVFPVALAATGAIAAGMAFLPDLRITLIVGFGLGFAAGLSFVMGYTLLHEYTDDAVRARTFASFYTATRLAMFVALGVAPFVAGIIGTGQLIIGNVNLQMSGVRLSILLGGSVALFSAVSAGRGMYRALADQAARPVKLPRAETDAGAGLFIAFEGVEGAGKSTQIRVLVDRLEAEGHDVLVTREPGGSPVAERIREVLLDPDSDMCARTEALLYAAARAEHVEKVILPALEAGQVVVCDRFIDSSLAYQGYARGLGETDVYEINRWAIGGIVPDVVVLLALEPEEGLRRVTERSRRAHVPLPPAKVATNSWTVGALGDRMEREGLDFHRTVAEAFLSIAKRDKRRFCIVDASADAGTVSREIRAGLRHWLPLPVVLDDDGPSVVAASEKARSTPGAG
jgi:dTMP kinase